MKSNQLSRIKLVSFFVVLIALLLIARLYMVQIMQGSDFSDRADRQYVRSNQSLYDRGYILMEDKYGIHFSLAELGTGFIVAIRPDLIVEPADTYNLLSSVIELDEEDFLYRVGKKGDPYEEIATRIEPELANRIDSFAISGVDIYKERWRLYPRNTLASQTVGFIAFNEDTLTGAYGLERYYNDILNRKDDGLYVNFFAEIFANLNKTIFSKSSANAGDIITSIEPSVQLHLEESLKKVYEKWNSNLTAGIIIDPTNGEIFALGVYPGFDLNNFQNEKNPQVFVNPLVESIYEMGSIIKPLTMAAALDVNAVTAKTTYYDNGFIELDGYTISNFDGKGRGRVNMQEVLSQSLNTGVSFAVKQMGNDVFASYIDAYGIGEETGIDLPNESAGLVQNLDSPRDIEYATASFGQGIAMTPIATVRALSVLANGGVLVTPHVAKIIKYKSGLSKRVQFNDGKRVLKEETSEEITRMLVKVVDEALRGGTVKLENYSIAAKTGTAQIAKASERGYYDDRFLHSFFGYFPAYEPRFLVFLLNVEPKEVRYASETLTEPFMDSVKFLINYYEIPPDR